MEYPVIGASNILIPKFSLFLHNGIVKPIPKKKINKNIMISVIDCCQFHQHQSLFFLPHELKGGLELEYI